MRRRLTRDQKLAVSAVAAGLLLAAGHGQGAPGHATAASTGSGSSNERLASSMAASGYGWTGRQMTCLDELWTEESGFSATAYNSSSGATGIPQLLPSAHALPANWSDPAVQIRWGLAYVHDRYGSPCAAWAFERSHIPNWY